MLPGGGHIVEEQEPPGKKETGTAIPGVKADSSGEWELQVVPQLIPELLQIRAAWGMFATLEKGTVGVTWENDNPIMVETHWHSSNFAAGPLAECTTATTSSDFESQLSWLGHRDDSPRGDESSCKGDSSRVSTLETQCSGRTVRVGADSALLGSHTSCGEALPRATVTSEVEQMCRGTFG